MTKREIQRRAEVANNEATKFHDSLILQFLACLQTNNHRQNKKVEKLRADLAKQWRDYCRKKQFKKDGLTIFTEQCDRILEGLDKAEAQSKKSRIIDPSATEAPNIPIMKIN